MQNYEKILEDLGIEIPEDKKADLKKKMSENYKTVADYNKQVEKKDEYKTSLDEVQSKLADLEKEDVDGLKTKITTLTQELADEKEARAKEAKQTELRDKVKDFLSDKKICKCNHRRLYPFPDDSEIRRREWEKCRRCI